MKKVLVVLLSLCMVLGCFSFAAAGSFTDVAADDANLAAINVLSGLEVLLGDAGTTNFRPTDGLKRVEACVIIDKLLGYGDLAAVQTATTFSDVPASYWGSGWVAVASSLGLIEGNGDGTFAPEAQLTYDQWLTILVRAMGYPDDVLVGNWPQSAEVMAKNLGIVTAKQIGSTPADRSNVAGMAFNVLTSTNRASYDAKFNKKEVKTSLLEDVFGASVTKNVLADYASTGAAADYVGQVGTAYSVLKSGKSVVVAFVPNAKLASYTGTISGDYLVLADKTKLKLAAVTAFGTEAFTAKTYFNGEEDPLVAGKPVTVWGTLDSTGKTLAYVSQDQWVATEDLVALTATQVSKIAAAVKKVNDDNAKNGTKVAVVTVPELKANAVFSIADVENLKKDDVVTLYMNGNNVNKVAVSDATVTGAITSKTAAGKYVIGGTAYATTLTTLKVGDAEATYRLNAAGVIVDKVAGTVATPDYAVVTTTAAPVTTGYASSQTTTYHVEMLTADGETAVYNFAKSFVTKQTDTNWYKAFAANTVVTYALNDDGEIKGMNVAPAYAEAAGKWNSKYALLDNKALADDVMIVFYDSDEEEWTIKKVSAIVSGEVKYIVGSTSKKVEFIKLDELYAEEELTVAMFASASCEEVYDAELKDSLYNYSAIVDGEAKTIVSKSPLSFATNTDILVGKLYSLTVKDGFYYGVANLIGSSDFEVAGTVTADASATLVSVANNLYGLSDELQVYVKTVEGGKTTITAGSYLDLAKENSVVLYDLADSTGDVDGAYDIAVVTVNVQ